MLGCRGMSVQFVIVDSGDTSRQIIRYFSDKLMKSPSDHAAGIIDGSYQRKTRGRMFGTLSEERHKHQGAAVINVGANAVSDTSRKSGYRLVGDVDFAQASKVAGFITPV
ncbi:unnamed protein product, partial [Brassica oleracea]